MKKKNKTKEQKKQEKNRKKLKTTLEWMNIEEINDTGIFLKDGETTKYVKGICLTPINIFLLSDKEVKQIIHRLSSTIDKLYQTTLYFKFIKTEPDVTMQTTDYLHKLQMVNNPSVAKILQTEIDKLELFRSYNREVKFYVLIQETDKHIDKMFELLFREFRYAWGQNQIREMGYEDYKSVVQQELCHEYVDEYLFTNAVLPEESIFDELKEGEENEQIS